MTPAEIIAQAIQPFVRQFPDPDDGSGAAQIVLDLLMREGLKIVPREPTAAMVDAVEPSKVLSWSSERGEGIDFYDWDEAWRAMWDAA